MLQVRLNLLINWFSNQVIIYLNFGQFVSKQKFLGLMSASVKLMERIVSVLVKQ